MLLVSYGIICADWKENCPLLSAAVRVCLFLGHVRNTSARGFVPAGGDSGGQDNFINLAAWASPPSPAFTLAAALPAPPQKNPVLVESSIQAQAQASSCVSLTMLMFVFMPLCSSV